MYLQKIAEEAGKTKCERTFEEIVPEQYWDFSKVFSESKKYSSAYAIMISTCGQRSANLRRLRSSISG
jgi:hypothetical protein